MKKKKNDIPAEFTDKWRIIPSGSEPSPHHVTPSGLNVPPKLEECVMNWSIEKGKSAQTDWMSKPTVTRPRANTQPTHLTPRLVPTILQAVPPPGTPMDVSSTSSSNTPPPRPPRPAAMTIAKSVPTGQKTNPPVNTVPVKQPVSPHQPVKPSTESSKMPSNQFSYRNQKPQPKHPGPVPHSLNLDVHKYNPPRPYQQPGQLPSVQELFKTADHPNLYPAPTPMVVDDDRTLLNNLTSRFMQFPEDKKPYNPQPPPKKEDSNEPTQRHTI